MACGGPSQEQVCPERPQPVGGPTLEKEKSVRRKAGQRGLLWTNHSPPFPILRHNSGLRGKRVWSEGVKLSLGRAGEELASSFLSLFLTTPICLNWQ